MSLDVLQLLGFQLSLGRTDLRICSRVQMWTEAFFFFFYFFVSIVSDISWRVSPSIFLPITCPFLEAASSLVALAYCFSPNPSKSGINYTRVFSEFVFISIYFNKTKNLQKGLCA